MQVSEEVIHKRSTRIRMLDDLPPLPKVAQLILNEISDENVDIKKLSKVIEMDPGLVARIVGLSNSAFFAPTEKIYSVSDAIIKVLGLNTVKSLALSVLMASPFQKNECKGFRLDVYWNVAMLSATFIKHLTHTVCATGDEVDPSTAYISALLHNIGLLVMAHCFHNELEQLFIQEPDYTSEKFIQMEHEIIGITHFQAGAILAKKWHIPDSINTVIEHHNNPSYHGNYEKITLMVGVAARLAYSLCHDSKIEINKDTLERLCISLSMLEKIKKEVIAHKKEIENISKFMATP